MELFIISKQNIFTFLIKTQEFRLLNEQDKEIFQIVSLW